MSGSLLMSDVPGTRNLLFFRAFQFLFIVFLFFVPSGSNQGKAHAQAQIEVPAAEAPEATTPQAPRVRQLKLRPKPVLKRRVRAVSVASTTVTPSKDANAISVSIISGGIAGTYLPMANDLMNVLDQPGILRVLPMVGRGSLQNIRDVISLRGVDLAMVQTDSLQSLKQDPALKNSASQLSYVTRLYNEEMHIVANRDITDIAQLNGKKINIDVQGSGSNYSSRLVFDRLGIKPEFTEVDQALGLEKLQKNEVVANVFWGGKPLNGVARFANDGRFYLLPVKFDDRLVEDYLPGSFTSEDYPQLVKAGESPQTIAVGNLLVVYNWPQGSERYRKLERFVQALFAKFDDFQKPPRHPKWRGINLAAEFPGLKRFKPAQDILDQDKTAQSPATTKAAFDAFLLTRPAGPAGEKNEKIFEEFLQWQKTQPKK